MNYKLFISLLLISSLTLGETPGHNTPQADETQQQNAAFSKTLELPTDPGSWEEAFLNWMDANPNRVELRSQVMAQFGDGSAQHQAFNLFLGKYPPTKPPTSGGSFSSFNSGMTETEIRGYLHKAPNEEIRRILGDIEYSQDIQFKQKVLYALYPDALAEAILESKDPNVFKVLKTMDMRDWEDLEDQLQKNTKKARSAIDADPGLSALYKEAVERERQRIISQLQGKEKALFDKLIPQPVIIKDAAGVASLGVRFVLPHKESIRLAQHWLSLNTIIDSSEGHPIITSRKLEYPLIEGRSQLNFVIGISRDINEDPVFKWVGSMFENNQSAVSVKRETDILDGTLDISQSLTFNKYEQPLIRDYPVEKAILIYYAPLRQMAEGYLYGVVFGAAREGAHAADSYVKGEQYDYALALERINEMGKAGAFIGALSSVPGATSVMNPLLIGSGYVSAVREASNGNWATALFDGGAASLALWANLPPAQLQAPTSKLPTTQELLWLRVALDKPGPEQTAAKNFLSKYQEQGTLERPPEAAVALLNNSPEGKTFLDNLGFSSLVTGPSKGSPTGSSEISFIAPYEGLPPGLTSSALILPPTSGVVPITPFVPALPKSAATTIGPLHNPETVLPEPASRLAIPEGVLLPGEKVFKMQELLGPGWSIRASESGGGVVFSKVVEGDLITVRFMPERPNAPYPEQRPETVIVTRETTGKKGFKKVIAYGADGQVVPSFEHNNKLVQPGSVKSPAAHILRKDFDPNNFPFLRNDLAVELPVPKSPSQKLVVTATTPDVPPPQAPVLERYRTVMIPPKTPTIKINGLEVAYSGKNPTEAIRTLGVRFNDKLSLSGATYSVSQFVDLGAGRVGVLAIVESPNSFPTLRIFYRSKSQSNWRVLPAINEPATLLPMYDKGSGEGTLDVPAEFNQILSARLSSGTKPIHKPLDPNSLLTELIPDNKIFLDYLRYVNSPEYIGNQIEKYPVFSQGEAKYPRKNGPPLPEPSTVKILNPNLEPDFSKVTQYSTDSALSGKVDVLVYPSKDGSLTYSFVRDKDGKVWVSSIQDTNSAINDFGVKSKTPVTGPLTTPRWEYVELTPQKFQGDRNPTDAHYVDFWKYLREMPVIQEWYRQKNLPIPE